MQKLILLSSLLCCSALCFSQSGELDPAFGNKGIVTTDMGSRYDYSNAARQVITGPGGSIYIIFNNPTYVSKRLPNGSVDSSYGFNGYSGSIPFTDPYAVLQPDGKLVLAGSGFNITRLNAKGIVDSSFGSNGIQTADFGSLSFASTVAITTDGKIVVAGTYYTGDAYFAVARYNANGSPDITFKGKGEVTTDFGFKMPPGRGETDSTPILQQYATTMGLQQDGKIVVGGHVTTSVNNDFALARYNADGSLDNTFDNDGKQTTDFGDDDNAYALAIQSDGKILLAGQSAGSASNFGIARYNTNGSLDNSFNGNGKQVTTLSSDFEVGNSLLALQSTGKIVVAGYNLNGTYNDFSSTRFNTDGTIDNTFGNGGSVNTDFVSSDDYAGSVTIQSDDKIMVAGYSYIYSTGNTSEHFTVSRYKPDGIPDSSFADNGKLNGVFNQGNTIFYSTTIQPDQKIVAAGVTWNGSDYDFAIARYNNNGTTDSSFNSNGRQITDFGSGDDRVYSVVTQSDGKIIAAGTSSSQFAIARYNANGSPDVTFNSTGKLIIPIGGGDECRAVALQSDGKIVLAGYSFSATFDSVHLALVRLNTDGTLDNSFGDEGKQLSNFNSAIDFAEALVIQNDAKIVISGYSYVNGDSYVIARFKTDGRPDSSFANNGGRMDAFGPDNYYSNALAIQKDGKLVAAGFTEIFGGTSSAYTVVRYNSNGTIDSTFSGDGYQSTNIGNSLQFATSVAITDDGRIALGGSNDNFGVILYKNDGSPDSSFGSNGVKITNIGTAGSRINALKFLNGKLYAAGLGQFPGTQGVLARYLFTEGGPLPVSLLDFTGVLQNKSILLQWKIATEKNLAKFIIERSADGNNFFPINSVAVSGAIVFTRKYSITDNQPLQGINFYRLKMVDADGKFTYSNIIAVKINSQIKLQVFPNPVSRVLFVEANGDNENAIIQIIDVSGRKIKEMKVFLNGETSFSIDISNLANGIYNLSLQKKEKTEVQTFIKR